MRVIDSHSFVRPRPPKHVTKARENGSKAATTHTVTMKEKIIFETSEPLTLVAPAKYDAHRLAQSGEQHMHALNEHSQAYCPCN